MKRRRKKFSMNGHYSGSMYIGKAMSGTLNLWMDVCSTDCIAATPSNLRAKAKQLREFAAYLEGVARGDAP